MGFEDQPYKLQLAYEEIKVLKRSLEIACDHATGYKTERDAALAREAKWREAAKNLARIARAYKSLGHSSDNRLLVQEIAVVESLLAGEGGK